MQGWGKGAFILSPGIKFFWAVVQDFRPLRLACKIRRDIVPVIEAAKKILEAAAASAV